ncbi:Gem-associated protein 2 [Durusdinium trenchii]|uniref:Gem-associated protein 2 n=1 Tax=Durusdinium trenchii TaxID=1381693 RepID=A0ABP0STM3_9DINO
MDVDVKERRSKQKVGGPLTGRDGRGGLLAQFQTPELPKDFYSQVWAEDTAAAFRHLRKLCQDSRPKEPPQSLTYEEWRRHVAKDQPCFDLLSQQDFVSINHLVVVAVDKIEADYELKELKELKKGGTEFDDIQYQLQRLRRNCCRLVTATESEAHGSLRLAFR